MISGKRLLFLNICCSTFILFQSAISSAQDTNLPAVMSKAQYDSTLRALKKVNETKRDTIPAVKRQDSVPKPAIVKDSGVKAAAVANGTAATKLPNNKEVISVVDTALPADTSKRKPRERFGYIALNYGMGIPLSGYTALGAAANGQNFSLCAEFPGLISRYCWTFKFDYGLNGINIPQYLHNASEYIYPQYQYSMNFPVPSYSYYSIMTGISRIFPVGRLTFDARVLFGFLKGVAPQTSYSVSDSGKTINVTLNRCAAWAFAFGFGLDARYRINSGFSLLVNYDYLTAHPAMQLVSSGFITSPFSPTAPALSTYTQAFMLNNLTIGIGYTIAGK